MTIKILALDLGKFKTICCCFGHNYTKARVHLKIKSRIMITSNRSRPKAVNGYENIANLNFSATLPPIKQTLAFVLVLSDAVLVLDRLFSSTSTIASD